MEASDEIREPALACWCGEGPFASGVKLAEHQDKAHGDDAGAQAHEGENKTTAKSEPESDEGGDEKAPRRSRR